MMRRFTWALRRELWENRWLYLAPVAIAVALLLGFIAYAFRLPGTIAALRTLDAAHLHRGLVEPYDIVAGIMMGIGLIIAAIYCVDALYGERRDRSILLWKSLPVSDLETVLAKLAIPILVLPLICWALTVVLQLLMLGVSSAILSAHGESAAMLRAETQVLPNAIALLYHLVALHGIGFAPIYGWLLLVSAWAPRAPLAWAILPPAAIGIIERLAFGTTGFVHLLISPLSGGGNASQGATSPMAGRGGLMDELMQPSIAQFLAAPALWIGLVIATLFVLGATRVRRAAQPG